MADQKRPSIAEILAAARKQGSGGGVAPAGGEVPPATDEKAQSPSPAPSESDAPAAKPAPKPAPAKAVPAKPAATTSEVAESKPAAKPAGKAMPAKAASGGRPSVAEMLAMARGGAAAKPAAASETPVTETPTAPVKPAAAKPAAAAKPVAAKPAEAAKPAAKKPTADSVDGGAAKESSKAASGVLQDTSSILVAARKTGKPGPLSKAEAAKLSPDGEPAAKPGAKSGVAPMPAKPDYAKPKAAKGAPPDENRRSFLYRSGRFLVVAVAGSFLAVGFSALTATFSLWTLGFARFMFPNILTEPPSRFKVGFPADFPPGAVEEKFKAQFGVWIAKAEYNGQMQIYALKTVCTHLGCTPNWLEGEQKFKCPCHGSGFYKDGINFEGPAPRPLERYAISLASDGQIEVDKSKIFQEEMGQWKDAASFVPV